MISFGVTLAEFLSIPKHHPSRGITRKLQSV